MNERLHVLHRLRVHGLPVHPQDPRERPAVPVPVQPVPGLDAVLGRDVADHEPRLLLAGDDQYLVQLLGYLLDVHAVRPRLVHRPDRRSVHLIGARLHELQGLQHVRALGAQDAAQLEIVLLPTVFTLAELLQPVEGLRTNRPLALLDVVAMSDILHRHVRRHGLCLNRDRLGHLLHHDD